MDPGRKYEKCVSNNTNKWKCIFCMKETNEGISRLKHHLVGGNTSITVCPNCPEHVRAELQNDAAYKMLDRQVTSKLYTYLMLFIYGYNNYMGFKSFNSMCLTQGFGVLALAYNIAFFVFVYGLAFDN